MNNTILNMNKKADELYEKNNRYYTIITVFFWFFD